MYIAWAAFNMNGGWYADITNNLFQQGYENKQVTSSKVSTNSGLQILKAAGTDTGTLFLPSYLLPIMPDISRNAVIRARFDIKCNNNSGALQNFGFGIGIPQLNGTTPNRIWSPKAKIMCQAGGTSQAVSLARYGTGDQYSTIWSCSPLTELTRGVYHMVDMSVFLCKGATYTMVRLGVTIDGSLSVTSDWHYDPTNNVYDSVWTEGIYPLIELTANPCSVELMMIHMMR